MIEIRNLHKSFDDIKAIDNISLDIKEKEVFGLIGTNGAGKSTLLRILSGVYKEDLGSVKIDGSYVYDNPACKENIFLISDDMYFFPGSNALEMMRYYKSIYKSFNVDRFNSLMKDFDLDPNRKINTFSKGMKKQLSIILGISANTKYIFCDETFDGLDPVMRQGVKSIFANDIISRGLSPIIASHNLRELEDICDNVGLLHKGGVILSENLGSLKTGLNKVQFVPENIEDLERILKGLKIINKDKRGKLITLTVSGDSDLVRKHFEAFKLIFFEMLPLSLEEIFISKTEVLGYDIKKFLL